MTMLKTFTVLATLSVAAIPSQPAMAFGGTNVSPQAIALAIKAYNWAAEHGQVRNKRILTVVDLTAPSNSNRMVVLDMQTRRVLMALPVANGHNSGFTTRSQMSDIAGSHDSVPGTFVTTETYFGKHGLSLRIAGLEKGINDKAASRAIVIHPAFYASQAYINANGRTGRSWGCFAIDPARSSSLINLIKGGSVLFAYTTSENNDPYIRNA